MKRTSIRIGSLTLIFCALCVAAVLLQGTAASPATTSPTTAAVSLVVRITTLPSPEPSLVTLDINNEPLKTILKSVKDQTGNEIPFEPSNQILPAPIVFSVHKQSFWTAISVLCGQVSGVVISSSPPPYLKIDLALSDTATFMEDPYCDTHGVAAVAITGAEHNAQLHQSDHSDVCNLQFEANWEPRITPLFYCDIIIPDQATDEAGVSLLPSAALYDKNAAAVDPAHLYQVIDQIGSIPIFLPPNAGHRIAVLKGKLKFVVASKQAVFQVDPADINRKGLDVPLSPAKTVHLSISRLSDRVEFTIEQSRPRGLDQLDWNLQKCMFDHYSVTAYDNAGHEQPQSEFQIMEVKDDHVSKTFHIPCAPGNCKISVCCPIEVKTVQMPVEFHDIPIP